MGCSNFGGCLVGCSQCEGYSWWAVVNIKVRQWVIVTVEVFWWAVVNVMVLFWVVVTLEIIPDNLFLNLQKKMKLFSQVFL